MCIRDRMKEIVNVVVIMLLVIVIFSILGVQLFSGKFYACNDPTAHGKADCIGVQSRAGGGQQRGQLPVTQACAQLLNPPQRAGSFVSDDGTLTARDWSNPRLNFDNLPNAAVSMFVFLTLDSYVPIMYSGMSTTAKDVQPRREANRLAFLFFFSFVLVCVFAMMQMFIGIVFYHYTKQRQKSDGTAGLNSKQRQWLELSSLVCSRLDDAHWCTQTERPLLMQHPTSLPLPRCSVARCRR